LAGDDVFNLSGIWQIFAFTGAGDDTVNLGTNYSIADIEDRNGGGNDTYNLGSGQDSVAYALSAEGQLIGSGKDIITGFNDSGDDIVYFATPMDQSPPQPTFQEADGHTIVGTGRNTVTIDAVDLAWSFTANQGWMLT
jgi:hypothetical protein